MTARPTQIEEMWTDLIDRDLDALIAGTVPANEDLAPLEWFIGAMAAFGRIAPDPVFIEEQAARSASAIRETRTEVAQRPVSASPVMNTLRRKGTAALASLAMLTGVTGVAWASDAAVPGDWNYGIDRALEAIGIGAGGAQERLLELASLEPGEDHGTPVADSAPETEPTAQSPNTGDGLTGLAHAAATVTAIDQGSAHARSVRVGVAMLLEYLADDAGLDPKAVSEIAKMLNAGTAASNKPDHGGKPDETGKPATSGKPSTPGKSGSTPQP